MKIVKAFPLILAAIAIGLLFSDSCLGQHAPTADQLQKWLEQFPDADTNGDGTLSIDEAIAYRKKFPAKTANQASTNRWKKNQQGKWKRGIKRSFKVDPGWELNQFPEHSVSNKTPADIKAIYEKVILESVKSENRNSQNAKPEKGIAAKQPAVVSFPKPDDGAVRVVGVGHSFMMPGYHTLPFISRAAGMKQPLYTHVGGGMTGSARYKWEQENGIFQFDGKPIPKLLSSIANAKWDAMTFGPYYNDRPVYYSCWIEFCLKHNPDMKFYLSDGWPQLEQLVKQPKSEAFFTAEILEKMGQEKRWGSRQILDPLRQAYPGKVFVMPTSDAMVLAAKHFINGELPGIEGLHRAVGGKERSLWKDQLGHLGPGLERLEGYVFYATLYGKSPERINNRIEFGGDSDFPSPELDRMFRKIAWQAVIEHPNSGVIDKNRDGINDAFDASEATDASDASDASEASEASEEAQK